jgi:ADP-ribosyl-[dinitrogen reductase] hydrolase
LGAPLEGSPQPDAWVTEMLPGGRHSRKKGQITDDTLQAIAVGQSLVACNGFCGNDIVKKLLKGYIVRPEWYGPTSSAFFDLIQSGTMPHHAAWLVHKRNHGSRSNGSVMRGFPLGIFYPAPEVYTISLECSKLTHYDAVAGHCSAFLNVMVSDICRGTSRTAAFRHARSLCVNKEVHALLGNYDDYEPEPSLDCVLCSHAALYCFMNARTLEYALLSAINLGGEADTVGACCGALAGAYWGLGAIPERWSSELEGYSALVRLAENLWQISQEKKD